VFARGNRQRYARLLCDQLPFVRSLIVCAIRDDRAIVFGQLHDVAVCGLMVDLMRGTARRWSKSVISRELKCGRGKLKLFDAIPALAQKGEHAVGAAHMSRTGDNEVGLSTAQVSFDFSESDTDALQLSNNVSPILLLRAFAWLDCCSQ
jgi:hypothetical protein